MLIENKLKELEKIKDILQKDDLIEYELVTFRNDDGLVGCALFYNDNKTIKIYEGNPDGSDDKEMDYETFINNYTYELKREIDNVKVEIKI